MDHEAVATSSRLEAVDVVDVDEISNIRDVLRHQSERISAHRNPPSSRAVPSTSRHTQETPHSGEFADYDGEFPPSPSDIICFRIKEEEIGANSLGCTDEDCFCDLNEQSRNVEEFCDAITTFAKCRKKMCKFTVKHILCDSDTFGIAFRWLELGDWDQNPDNGNNRDGDNGDDNDGGDPPRDSDSSNVLFNVTEQNTDHEEVAQPGAANRSSPEINLEQTNASMATPCSNDTVNPCNSRTSTSLGAGSNSNNFENISLASSASSLSQVSSTQTPCEDEIVEENTGRAVMSVPPNLASAVPTPSPSDSEISSSPSNGESGRGREKFMALLINTSTLTGMLVDTPMTPSDEIGETESQFAILTSQTCQNTDQDVIVNEESIPGSTSSTSPSKTDSPATTPTSASGNEISVNPHQNTEQFEIIESPELSPTKSISETGPVDMNTSSSSDNLTGAKETSSPGDDNSTKSSVFAKPATPIRKEIPYLPTPTLTFPLASSPTLSESSVASSTRLIIDEDSLLNESIGSSRNNSTDNLNSDAVTESMDTSSPISVTGKGGSSKNSDKCSLPSHNLHQSQVAKAAACLEKLEERSVALPNQSSASDTQPPRERQANDETSRPNFENSKEQVVAQVLDEKEPESKGMEKGSPENTGNTNSGEQLETRVSGGEDSTKKRKTDTSASRSESVVIHLGIGKDNDKNLKLKHKQNNKNHENVSAASSTSECSSETSLGKENSKPHKELSDKPRSQSTNSDKEKEALALSTSSKRLKLNRPAPASVKRNRSQLTAEKVKKSFISETESEEGGCPLNQNSSARGTLTGVAEHDDKTYDVNDSNDTTVEPLPKSNSLTSTTSRTESNPDKSKAMKKSKTRRSNENSEATPCTIGTSTSSTTSQRPQPKSPEAEVVEVMLSSSDSEDESVSKKLSPRPSTSSSSASHMSTMRMLKNKRIGRNTNSGYASDDSQYSQMSNVPLMKRLIKRSMKRRSFNPNSVLPSKRKSSENMDIEEACSDILILDEMLPPKPKKLLNSCGGKRKVTSNEGIHIKFGKPKPIPCVTLDESTTAFVGVSPPSPSIVELDAEDELQRVVPIEAVQQVSKLIQNHSKKTPQSRNHQANLKDKTVPSTSSSYSVPVCSLKPSSSKYTTESDEDEPVRLSRSSTGSFDGINRSKGNNSTRVVSPRRTATSKPKEINRRPETPPRVAAVAAAKAIKPPASTRSGNANEQRNYDPRNEALKIIPKQVPCGKSFAKSLQHQRSRESEGSNKLIRSARDGYEKAGSKLTAAGNTVQPPVSTCSSSKPSTSNVTTNTSGKSPAESSEPISQSKKGNGESETNLKSQDNLRRQKDAQESRSQNSIKSSGGTWWRMAAPNNNPAPLMSLDFRQLPGATSGLSRRGDSVISDRQVRSSDNFYSSEERHPVPSVENRQRKDFQNHRALRGGHASRTSGPGHSRDMGSNRGGQRHPRIVHGIDGDGNNENSRSTSRSPFRRRESGTATAT